MFTKKQKFAAILGGSLAVAMLLAAAYYWHRSSEREQAIKTLSALFAADSRLSWKTYLPQTASEVQEWSWADGFLPDYAYQLKARITEAEFRKFVSDLGLTPHTAERKYSEQSWLSWRGSPAFEGTWWDASGSLDSTYVTEGHNTWSYAKFENGFLYFKSLNH